MIKVVFDVPFHGSILLLLAGAALCVLSGIGIGTVIATFTQSAYQAQLTSFFVNPLLTTASGAITPAEAIPNWLQPLVKINPDPPLQRHCALQHDQGQWNGNAVAELLVLSIFTLIMVSAERLALPETTQLVRSNQ